MDLLFSGVTVVTLDPCCTVLRDAFVGVEDGRISYVGKNEPEGKAARTIRACGKVLMPGLVNAHTHLPMTLFRGLADDAPLSRWLREFIWPAESRLDGRAVRAGTELAIAEILASGTVSVSDMYNFSCDIASCVAESGIKANISRALMCMDGDFDPATDERLREAVELADAWHGHNGGQIAVEVSVHAEYTSPPELWEAAAALAMERGLGMHVHVSETLEEHEACLSRHGLTPTAALDRSGVFSTRATVAHGVWLTDADMDILSSRRATVAHCPVSNLKLASGVAPVAAMLSKGINVALGTDGAASNNTLDIWEEIKSSALLAKNVCGAPESFTAPKALSLAVGGGATAQGRAGETGRISVGFDADLILIDFGRPHLAPCHDPISHLAYAVRGADVCMTVVRGRILYENGVFPTIDMERTLYDIEHYAMPLLFNPKEATVQ